MASRRANGARTGAGTGIATERNFVGHIIKVHRHEKDSTKEWRWLYVLLQLQSGAKVLVELRYVKRSYYLRLGDKVSVVTKNVMSAHRLPCLQVPDEMLEMMEPSTVGCICCPEIYEHARFDVLTQLNAEIPSVVIREYEKMMAGDGSRRQMTFMMLAEEIAMRKSERWYAFVSAIILRVDLCKMLDMDRLFSARCECGNFLTAGRKQKTTEKTDKCMACKGDVELKLNPQILGGLADETGGFCNSGKLDEDHAVLLADRGWSKLLQSVTDVHETLLNGIALSSTSFRAKLEAAEEELLYTRKTFVFCWTGTWGGGRLVIVDVL